MKRNILAAAILALATPLAAMAAGPVRQTTPSDAGTAAMASSTGMAQARQATAGAHYAEVNGAKIYYRVSGHGEPMLLIHGYPLNSNLFSRVRKVLDPHCEVITPDLPGFGHSTVPSSEASLSMYAKDMFGLMDKLGIHKAIIGGHSMGGMTTIEMYKQQPDRFAGMILIDTAAAAAPLPGKGEWDGFAKLARKSDHDKVMDNILVPYMLSYATIKHDPQMADDMKKMINAASVNGDIGGAHALANRPDNRNVLKQVKVPTLILVGSADELLPYAIAKKMHEAVPGSKLDVVMGGAHAEILGKADVAGKDIVEWMRQSKGLTTASATPGMR